jgi:hypothetical protein
MKILNIHKTTTTAEIFALLQQKLNPLFHEQKQSDMSFDIQEENGAVEIWQPEIYEGFLFRIEPHGTQLHITRSEHYVDDVNSITVESILNSLFEELAKDGNVTLVLEG